MSTNLIPGQHKLTVEELSKGGKKSAKVRSQRKKAREIAEEVLSMPIKKGKLTDLEDIDGLDRVENTDVLTAIIASIARKATEGSVRHAEMLLTLTGDYSKKMEVKPIMGELDGTVERLMEEMGRGVFSVDGADRIKVDIQCKVNKYSYAMYNDTMVLSDFTTDELRELLDNIYTYGIEQTETWGRPLDKGELINHLRNTIKERQKNEKPAVKEPTTVSDLLESARQRAKRDT